MRNQLPVTPKKHHAATYKQNQPTFQTEANKPDTINKTNNNSNNQQHKQPSKANQTQTTKKDNNQTNQNEQANTKITISNKPQYHK